MSEEVFFYFLSTLEEKYSSGNKEAVSPRMQLPKEKEK